jgi:hypothetical protein
MVSIVNSLKVYCFRYSFTVDGGAVSTIEAPFSFPQNVIIINVSLNVIAAVTGGANSEIEIGIGSIPDGSLFSAIPVATLVTNFVTVSFPGVPAIIGVGGSKPSITINADPLTAGIFKVNILYLEF